MSFAARLRQFVVVSGFETFGVAVAGVTGLLIVNVLPKEHYAIYTVLVACMQLMSGIADLSLGHSILPVVGERAHDKRWVVGVCTQIFYRRWMLMGLSVAIVVPYWAYTSAQHGWHGPGYLLAGLLVLAAVLLTLRDTFMHRVLLILQHIGTLNRNSFVVNSARLLLVGAVLLVPIGSYTVAGLFAALVTALFVSLQLNRLAFGRHGIPRSRLDPQERRDVDRQTLRIVVPLLPSAVFYHVQGVITILIVSLFGTASMMAEVGAFGRLAMVLTIVDRVTDIVLFPAIARAAAGPRLVARLLLAHAAYMLVMLALFATSLWLPDYWMLLLGAQYKSMQPLIWMVFLTSIFANAAGFAFRTLAARGATARQSLGIPLLIATQLAYAAIFGVSDLKAVLGFNLATMLVQCLYQYTLLALRLPGWRKDAVVSGAPTETADHAGDARR